MALVLDSTVGGLTANSYIPLADAQAIIDGTPNATAWGVDPVAQTLALVAATRQLDAMAYLGFKTKVSQALAWPRAAVLDPDYGDTSAAYQGYMVNGSMWGVYLADDAIPSRVNRATTALALEIMRAGTADVWGVDKTANIQNKKIDVIETEYIAIGDRRFGLRVYPSVWREIFPLLMASVSASVERA